MQYTDMIVEAADAQIVTTADKRRMGQFSVRVLVSPSGESEQAVPVSYDNRQLQASLQQLDSRALKPTEMIAFGRTLAALLLPDQGGGPKSIHDLFVASLDKIGPDAGLRLRLRLPPLLAALPWEYMYVDRAGGGEGMDGFLALNPRVAIVRHEVMPAPGELAPVEGTIKVVAAMASADGLPPLDLTKEKQDLHQALDDQPGVSATFLEDATLDEVLTNIAGAHVFHFAGHGMFNRQMGDLPGTYTGDGALALFDTMVGAEQLAVNLNGDGVRLALLGGCETGRRDGVSVWSGIAPTLVRSQAQVPAVIANQFSITDAGAIAFSKHFYKALVGGLNIEQAVAIGRVAAYNADTAGRDWGVPVLYLRSGDGQLFHGASDEPTRQQARSAAELISNVQVKQVAAGGYVAGAEIGKIRAGKLTVTVTAGTVAGEVVGAKIGTVEGGESSSMVNADTVEEGGSVTGLKVDNLG